MKKLLCIILTIIFVASSCVSLFVSAEEQNSSLTDHTETEKTEKEILYFSCTYNKELKKISISGNIMHDAFTMYKNHSIVIYAITPGKSVENIKTDKSITPILDDAALSVSFEFSFKAETLEQRYSKYAIFLKSPDGELVLAAAPRFADIKTVQINAGHKNFFKGVSSFENSVPTELGADTVIIPVYLDRIYSSIGYIYQGESKQLFFDKTYIDEIDSRVNSATVSGAKVYLQYLLRNNSQSLFSAYSTSNTNTLYILPDVYNANTAMLLHSATDFLISRYSEKSNLGIILGKALDERSKYNYCGNISYEQYVEHCAFYAILVANSARCVKPNTEIILPFSGHNFLDPNVKGQTIPEISVNNILNDILAYIRNNIFESIYLSLLIETTATPFNITNENLSKGVDLTQKPFSITAGNLSAFSEYFKSLKLKYNDDLLDSYMISWSPSNDLSGNALATAYTYSYYSFLKDNNVSTFIIDFSKEADNAKNFDDVQHIIKHIDTTEGTNVTQSLLKYFDKAESWTYLLGLAESTLQNNAITIYTVIPTFTAPDEFSGKFSYFDFSTPISSHDWVKGMGCQNIKTDFFEGNKKALRADLSFQGTKKSEIIHEYIHHENMRFTPYLDFSLKIDDGNKNALYNVVIVIENSNTRFEASCAIKGSTVANINLDFSKIKDFGNVGNIKILVSSLNGDVNKANLWIYEISGYSKTASSEELKNLIDSERNKINDSYNNEYENIPYNNIIISILIVIVSTAIVIVFAINLKRANKSNDNFESNDSNKDEEAE